MTICKKCGQDAEVLLLEALMRDCGVRISGLGPTECPEGGKHEFVRQKK